jgi:hypothetical protein
MFWTLLFPRNGPLLVVVVVKRSVAAAGVVDVLGLARLMLVLVVNQVGVVVLEGSVLMLLLLGTNVLEAIHDVGGLLDVLLLLVYRGHEVALVLMILGLIDESKMLRIKLVLLMVLVHHGLLLMLWLLLLIVLQHGVGVVMLVSKHLLVVSRVEYRRGDETSNVMLVVEETLLGGSAVITLGVGGGRLALYGCSVVGSTLLLRKECAPGALDRHKLVWPVDWPALHAVHVLEVRHIGYQRLPLIRKRWNDKLRIFGTLSFFARITLEHQP